MILAIRTDKTEAELYLLESGKIVDKFLWQAHRQLADTIHLKITDLIVANNKTLDSLNGIIVFKGPGSFTGLRIGITVANTLAYALKIPIVGEGGGDWISKAILRLTDQNDKIVIPEYGGEANITKPVK